MNALLQTIQAAAEIRSEAEDEFRLALARAHEGGCSWAQIADAAGLSRAGARWLVLRQVGAIDGHGRKVGT